MTYTPLVFRQFRRRLPIQRLEGRAKLHERD